MLSRNARSASPISFGESSWRSCKAWTALSLRLGIIRQNSRIRPEWLLNLAPMIRQGRMPVPLGSTGRHAPVAAEDQARLIVGILQNPGPHMGKTYPLFGPVELTQPEIAAVVGKVLGKEGKYGNVPIEKFAKLRSARLNQPRRTPQSS